MSLKININHRNLEYKSPQSSGEGLDSLIKNLDRIKTNKIIISGKSKSYTFLRQVALFVNLLVKTRECELELKSDSFKLLNDLLFPIYE